jgi:hypothetical protein
VLPDNSTGWKQWWFYLDNPASALLSRMWQALIPYPEWTNQLASRETKELRPLLDDLERLKTKGLTNNAVARSFSHWLIQPI